MARVNGAGRLAAALAAGAVAWAALRKSAVDQESASGGTAARGVSQDSSERLQGRGRGAERPGEIPTLGWRDILWRTYAQLGKDAVMLVAAGVTFYGLLSLFPAITALISIYGLFADPGTVIDQVEALSGVLPEEALGILAGQMERVAGQPTAGLGLGFAGGLAIALWSANNGMKAIVQAMNVAYNEEEKRGFFRLNAITLLFTLGAIAVVLLAVASIVVLPVVLGFVGLGDVAAMALRLARWPLLLLVIIVAVSLIYRYGPSRTRARWRWISPGSILASVIWVAASILFSWYVANFGTYNETYGSLGAVIAFMVWMWVSATIIIMGAELNAEIEHQTARDSTTGPVRPMGERGAMVADTLGQPVVKQGRA